MTQALNLALLGNNVNTSGQVSLTAAVSGTLPVANGGTGSTTQTANNVLLGNGTSAFLKVAPGTSGNVLTSNGSTWTSAAPPAVAPTTAQVLSATAGAAVGAVGTYAVLYNRSLADVATNGTIAGSSLGSFGAGGIFNTFDTQTTQSNTFGTAQTGTWRALAFCYRRTSYTCEGGDYYQYRPSLFLRIS